MLIDTNCPIRTVMFGKVHKEKGRWHTGRTSEHHILLYFTVGHMKMQVGGKLISLQQEDILLIPSGSRYVPLEAENLSYYFFHFSAPKGLPGTGELKMKVNTTLPEGQYAYHYVEDIDPVIEIPELVHCAGNLSVRNLFERVAALNVRTEPSHKLMMDCLVRELLILISASYLRKASVHENLRDILHYIDTHYPQNITLSSLAAQFDYSESYIARLFREQLGTSVSHYVNRLRIAAACDLLLSTSRGIGEIAEQVGYSTPYYFSRVFRSFCGCPPGTFRRDGSRMGI